jgi:hypothetical protein
MLGIINHSCTYIRSELCLSWNKIQIFAAFFGYLTVLIKNSPRDTVFFRMITAKPFHCSWERIFPFVRLQPNTCIVAVIQWAHDFLYCLPGISYCFISSYSAEKDCVEDDERQIVCYSNSNCCDEADSVYDGLRRLGWGTGATAAAVGIKLSKAPCVNKDSTPLCIVLLYFSEIILVVVEETSWYHHQCLCRLDHDLLQSLTSFILRCFAF